MKILPPAFVADPQRRERFAQEARTIAALNHPHICTLYDIGSTDATEFLVMELVEGSTLEGIGDLPLGVDRIVGFMLQVCDALAAAHGKGIVHRDLKPQNIMVTPGGQVKILDFGVAKLVEDSAPDNANEMRTRTRLVVGTPEYMSPEQMSGDSVGRASDIFSLGVIVYQLTTGRHPFAAAGAQQNMQALARALFAHTPSAPQQLNAAVPQALGDLLLRMLEKNPADRPTAAEVGQAVAKSLSSADATDMPRVRARRLIVLPFKVLRSDPDTDFLAFSLPDALAGSLANLETLVVRSSLAAGRLSADVDLRAIRQEADVDVVLSGTLVRAGEQIRVSAQLTDVAGGTLIWSQTLQAPMVDLFALQDSFVQQVVDSLAVPLTARERRLLAHDAPANALAYELFLRGNQAVGGVQMWFDRNARALALDLYSRSIEADPNFAPAWAAIGRLRRVWAKYEIEDSDENARRAESALKRAFDLNPDLSTAHILFAQLDLDLGRGRDALVRLLGRARLRMNDPDVFVALCQVCRYCGLLKESIAAHEGAVRLDSKIRTSSGIHTYFALGDYSRVVDLAERMWGSYAYIGPIALWRLGRTSDAIAAVRRSEETTTSSWPRAMVASARALFEGRANDSVAALSVAGRQLSDVEMNFYLSRQLAFLRQTAPALDRIEAAIAGGYYGASQLADDSWFDPIRGESRFQDLLGRAREGRDAAARVFRDAGGPPLLGLERGTL